MSVVEDALAGVSERRVPEVVSERDRFGQLFVEPQHLGDAARDLRDLQRVGQPRAVVIAGRREEHLGLVLEPAERLAVNDAIAVALKGRTDGILGSGRRRPRVSALLAACGREHLALALLELFANRGVPAVFGVTLTPIVSPADARSSCRARMGPPRTRPRRSARDRRTSRGGRDRRPRRTLGPTTNSGTCSRE